MRLLSLHLQDFRNYSSVGLDLDHPAHHFQGDNGQGKTNLLEAIGLVTALRSFRTRERASLARWGCRVSVVRQVLQHEDRGRTEILMRLEGGSVFLSEDGEAVKRLSEHLGLFPTVAFTSQDLQLVRGSPEGRRRFLDASLSGSHREYFESLKRYYQALAQRNALLKLPHPSSSALDAFEAQMADHAALLRRVRAEGVAALSSEVERVYATLADGAEVPRLRYQPEGPSGDEVECWVRWWREQRERDASAGTTRSGPHREDLKFDLFGREARESGSDGQQRALVLALRLGQAWVLRQASGVDPILLADDVLGELDPTRRARFWRATGDSWQVFASGTGPPVEDRDWATWSVCAGNCRRVSP